MNNQVIGVLISLRESSRDYNCNLHIHKEDQG